MYKTLSLLCVLLFTSTLEAYSKKIILASYTSEIRASSIIKKLPTQNPKIYNLSKKFDFDFKSRKSGKYYIVLVEVLHDKKILNKVLYELRKDFKGAYVSNYKVPAVVTKKQEALPLEKIVVEKMLMKEKAPEKEVLKSVKVKEIEIPTIPIPVVDTPTKELSISARVKNIIQEHFEWYYLVLFFLFSIFTFYFIKFKRIYDSY